MLAKCPNCNGIMESKYEDATSTIYKCTNCSKAYFVSDGVAKEIFDQTKECPNCNGVMNLTKDKIKAFYQSPEAEYYHCSRCGNSYSTSGIQLNDSKFNARRASDAHLSQKCYKLAAICFIIIIGYVIYGVFFSSINYIILIILGIVFGVSLLFGYVMDNQVYI